MQPEALRLAKYVTENALGEDIAVELRRLHEENIALFDALKYLHYNARKAAEKIDAALLPAHVIITAKL